MSLEIPAANSSGQQLYLRAANHTVYTLAFPDSMPPKDVSDLGQRMVSVTYAHATGHTLHCNQPIIPLDTHTPQQAAHRGLKEQGAASHLRGVGQAEDQPVVKPAQHRLLQQASAAISRPHKFEGRLPIIVYVMSMCIPGGDPLPAAASVQVRV